MRTIVFFDLPNVFLRDKKNYLKFRKYLINEGFLMLQESVYSKIVVNQQQSQLLVERIRKNSPAKGLIQVLIVTEKQYARMEYIIGKSTSKIINSDERLVVL